MKNLLVGLAMLSLSTKAVGQVESPVDKDCVMVTDTVLVCLKDDAQETGDVAISGNRLTFLLDPRVLIEVKAISYDPKRVLNMDDVAARLAKEISIMDGEKLITWGSQGAFLDWGHVRTQDFEIVSGIEDCAVFSTHRTISDSTMLVISARFCGLSKNTYGEIAHDKLLKSIWIKTDS
jgi:hypothetical protein